MNNLDLGLKTRRARPSLLAGAIALALTAGSAQALDFSTDEVSIQFDTTVSYSLGMRLEDPDSDLIAKSAFNPAVSLLPIEQQIAAPGRFSANSDDGNQNFDQYDLIFNQARITSELQVSYKNYGAFVRGNYFYDFTLNNKNRLSDDAKDLVGTRARLLDAYVWGNFDVGERQLSLRVGRQVVSWGESTFLPGGINVINPVDVSAIRTAGAELRDAFIPLGMVWGSLDLTQNLSMEAIYMYEWDRVEPEPAGSYFSTNDFATDGGRYAMLGFGLFPDDPLPLPGCDNLNAIALACYPAGNLPRTFPDNEPRDDGQYGVAFRYFAPWLNDTEFGLFYIRYHSRLPVLNGIAVTNSATSSGRVQVVYPEDIDSFGLSFNTTIFDGWAWQGENSYRPNLPLQIDDVELLFAGLSPLNTAIPAPVERFNSQLGQFEPGAEIVGFTRRDVSQAQMTFTKLFGPGTFFRSNQVAFVAEVGATHVWDMPDQDVLRLEGPGTDTGGGAGNQLTGGDLRNPITTTDGFATAFSWGYRMVIAPTYNSVFGSTWNMTPRLAFNHDVTGTSPGPGGNFIEGRKSLTLVLGLDYLAQWRVNFAYTNFFDGGINNLIYDRDFVSASVSYSF
ncbi:MAG: DUF1302 domain-containing protein [Pseudomonadota bacterium]